MTRPAQHIALVCALALTGCLPQITPPTAVGDAGDAGPDAQPDAKPDAKPDVDTGADADADADVSCEEILNPVEWCAERELCGVVGRAEGCPPVQCGDTCKATESCDLNENTCACDDAKITQACADSLNSCGPLTDMNAVAVCGGETVMCSQCGGFQTCDGESCGIRAIALHDPFAQTRGYRIGGQLAYRDGNLLMSSDPTGPQDNAIFSVELATRNVEPVELNQRNSLTGQALGASIDARGDYAIVGSGLEDPLGGDDDMNRMGIVRTYTFTNGSWAPLSGGALDDGALRDPERTLRPTFDTSDDRFGERVAVDYPYFAASAQGYNPDPVDSSTNQRGRVHLWRHNGSEFVEVDPSWVNPGDEETTFTNAQYGSSLELGGGMLFVGTVKTGGVGGTLCGSVSVFFLGEANDGSPVRVDLQDEDCLSADAAVRANTQSGHFGQSVLFDGERLFIAAPRYPAGSGQGALYIYDYDEDAVEPGDRFIDPTRIDLPLIDGLTFVDNSWSMTRAGGALVIGQNEKGLTRDPASDEPSLRRHEGVIAIFRQDEPGEWSFDTYWNPDVFKNQTYQFGSAVAGTPDGRVFVSAPSAAAPFGVPEPPIAGRGVVLELDIEAHTVRP